MVRQRQYIASKEPQGPTGAGFMDWPSWGTRGERAVAGFGQALTGVGQAFGQILSKAKYDKEILDFRRTTQEAYDQFYATEIKGQPDTEKYAERVKAFNTRIHKQVIPKITHRDAKARAEQILGDWTLKWQGEVQQDAWVLQARQLRDSVQLHMFYAEETGNFSEAEIAVAKAVDNGVMTADEGTLRLAMAQKRIATKQQKQAGAQQANIRGMQLDDLRLQLLQLNPMDAREQLRQIKGLESAERNALRSSIAGQEADVEVQRKAIEMNAQRDWNRRLHTETNLGPLVNEIYKFGGDPGLQRQYLTIADNRQKFILSGESETVTRKLTARDLMDRAINIKTDAEDFEDLLAEIDTETYGKDARLHPDDAELVIKRARTEYRPHQKSALQKASAAGDVLEPPVPTVEDAIATDAMLGIFDWEEAGKKEKEDYLREKTEKLEDMRALNKGNRDAYEEALDSWFDMEENANKTPREIYIYSRSLLAEHGRLTYQELKRQERIQSGQELAPEQIPFGQVGRRAYPLEAESIFRPSSMTGVNPGTDPVVLEELHTTDDKGKKIYTDTQREFIHMQLNAYTDIWTTLTDVEKRSLIKQIMQYPSVPNIGSQLRKHRNAKTQRK